MNNSDDLLREKEHNDFYNDHSFDEHWAALEKKIDDRPNVNTAKKILKSFIAIAAIIIVIFFVYKISSEKPIHIETNIAETKVNSAIKPAMKGVNVPYEEFSFDAVIGDTLFTKNGSIIIFPKNSVLKNNGEIVTGIIYIRTREFNDAFDYSIAGIPMNYDSAGVKYKFISSAMIDIKAYQNNELLLVNPAAKPQLNLVSTNKEKNTNLYRLDTLNGEWMNKGKDEVISIINNHPISEKNFMTQEKKDDVFVEENLAREEQDIKPVAPQKASAKNTIINIEIDPLSFKELMVYNNLKFEVMDHSVAEVGEDSKTEWGDVNLKKGEINGIYYAVFSTKNKTVKYKVKPVLEGKDFEVAEKLYQEKLKEYTKVSKQRRALDKEELKTLEQNARNENMIVVRDSMAVKNAMAENNKIDALNNLITLRNKYIEGQNKRMDSLANESRSKQIALEQRQRDMQFDKSLIRIFQIDGFGYWNCDMPSLPQTVPYACNFLDEKLNKISFSEIHLIAAGINRVMTFYSNSIALVPDKKHTVWTFSNDSFYYLDETSFDKTAWNKSKNVAVKMKKYIGKLDSYEDLKAVVFNGNF